jgi:hypothetical protein
LKVFFFVEVTTKMSAAATEMVTSNFKKILGDNTFSDLQIKIGKDILNVHRGIVAIRCGEVYPLPDPNPKKKQKEKAKDAIVLKQMSNPAILLKVMEFLYTGKVNFPSLGAPEAIMELNKAAKVFNLRRLSYLCEDYFQTNINQDNLFVVLAAADKLNEPTVKSFCKFFAIEHFNEIVTNNQGLHILGIDLFQEVVTAYLTYQATKSLSKVSLGDPPSDTILDDFKQLYRQMPYHDVKFIFENSSDEVLCHKAVLGGYSEKFKALCKDPPPGGILLSNISPSSFRFLLQFLYYGDDEIEPLPACELVGFARQYEINDLVRLCENKIRNSVNIDTVLGILEVAYQPEMVAKPDLVEELKQKTFPFVLENFNAIDFTPLKAKLTPKSVAIASDLILYIQKQCAAKKGK